MRRIVLLLLALALALTSVWCALGEGANEEQKITFLYFPTEDAVKFKTAQYLIKTQIASKKDASVSFANINYRMLYKNMSDAIIAGKSWSGELSSDVMNKVLNKIEEDAGSDLWFLIPEETISIFFHNDELRNWMHGLMEAGNTTFHFALIGDQATIPEDSLDFLRAFDTRCEIESLGSDFLAATTEKKTGICHTGDYYIASLYGAPMDLPLTATEEGGYTFALPEDSRVFLLRRDGEIPTVTAESGQDVSFDETGMLEVAGPQQRDPVFHGRMIEFLAAGTYTLQAAENEVDGGMGIKGYWYPDLEGLTVSAETQEILQHGANSIHFTLSKDYERLSDMTVEYTFAFDGQESGMAAVADYTEENGWNAILTADIDNQSIQIIPAASLYMADGNLVFSITGEPVEKAIQNQPVSLRADLPESLTLYLDREEDRKGILNLKWSDFFMYNPADKPELDVKMENATEENEADSGALYFTIGEKDEDGFSVTAVMDERTEPRNLIVTCDDKQAQVLIYCADIEDVIADQIHVISDESGMTLKPGDKVTLKTTVDETLAETLTSAREQGLNIPDLSSLELLADLDDQHQQIVLSADGAKELSFELKNEEGGEKTVTYQLVTIASSEKEGDAELTDEKEEIITTAERVWSNGEITCTLQNEAPVLKEEFSAQTEDARIPLQGLFGKMEPADLLKEMFGTENLCDLFSDEETEVLFVTLDIDGMDGLEAEEPGQETKAGHEQFTFANGETPIKIQAVSPGTHILTLKANDGVNESEPVVIRVKVYSLFGQYLTWAGIALGAVLLVFILILVIRQARKPSFSNIKIRCMVISDEDTDRCHELMNKETPVSLASFGKKPLPMNAVLILTGQPPLSVRNAEIVKDITLLPTRHEEIVLVFGKEAMQQLGRREKKDLIAQGNMCRIRLDSTWLQIENVR